MWKDKTHLHPRLYACFKDKMLIISIVSFATHHIQRFWDIGTSIFEKPLLCLIHTIWENLLTQVLSCISCISCISSRSHSSSLDCTNRWISALHILSAAVMLVLSFLKWVLDKPYKLINWFLPIASVPISRRAFKFKHLGSGYRCFPKIPGFYELMPSAQKMHPFLDCLVAAHHSSRHILWRL